MAQENTNKLFKIVTFQLLAYFLLHLNCSDKDRFLLQNLSIQWRINEGAKMIKIVNDQSIDRVALRQKGWKWFSTILVLQILMIIGAYIVA